LQKVFKKLGVYFIFF